MTYSDREEAVMVRYLLGLATEEETARVEEHYFSESEYFDQLLALEASLVDDFVTGRMPADQRSAFEESLSFRSDDIRFTRALFQAATKKKAEAGLARKPKRRATVRWRMLFAQPRLFTLSASTVAMVLLALSITLFFMNKSLRNQLSQSETQLAGLKEAEEAAQEQLSREQSQRETSLQELENERNRRMEAENLLQRREASNHMSDFLTVRLGAAFSFRGGVGAIREVPVPSNVRWLRFEMPVKGYGDYESYRVSIKPAGQKVVLERASLIATKLRLVLTARADELKPGDYVLTLFGEKAAVAPTLLEQYSFRITP